VILRENGVEVGRVPVAIATEPPEYRRKGVRPAELQALNNYDLGSLPDVSPDDATDALLQLLNRPNIASRRPVYRQYDQQVLGNTVVQPGCDAAVVRIAGTDSGFAVKTDCNSRLCYLDPYVGAAAAVAESARNVVCTGATPVAVTDCLNFGDPEKPEVYYQLEQAIRGIAEACSEFDTPVVSGNVSLFNESGGRPVFPTPVIGMLGLIDDVHTAMNCAFSLPGADVWLLGAGVEQPATALAGSEYLEMAHDLVAGLPVVDLTAESRLQRLVLAAHSEGLLLSAHDCSDGGLAVALVESALAGEYGFRGDISIDGRLDAALFGEAQGRIVVFARPEAAARLDALARQNQVPLTRLGAVVEGDGFSIGPVQSPLGPLRDAYETGL
ncbi:MAG: phosphoribosylformylglycinamidine synthase II, partial [Dehalococcoidia bacterium]|nr:phosphoribosylformylglycinamidine synthase II [Dehalococcoidia bacterium]